VIPDFRQVRFSVIPDFRQVGVSVTVPASRKLGTSTSIFRNRPVPSRPVPSRPVPFRPVPSRPVPEIR